MIEYFKKLLDYDLWANSSVIESILNNSINDTSTELLFSHILNSQQIWHSRIKGYPAHQTPWDIIPSQNFPDVLNLVNKDWILLLDSSTKINEIIEYTNIKGEPFKNTIQDILTHVLNHSTYHRAQISSKIKTLGFTPPITDYIEFARKQ